MSARRRYTAVACGLVLAAGPAAAQRAALSGTLSFAEHRVDAGFGLERTAGLLAGAALDAGAGAFDLRAHVRAGRLRLRSATGADADVAELGVAASARLLPWLAARGALLVRGFSADVGRQRWDMAELGLALRVPLAEGRIHGFAQGSWRPVVRVSGLPRLTTAFAAAAGTEYDLRRLSVAILYELERCDFPAGPMARFEQWSALTLQATLRPSR